MWVGIACCKIQILLSELTMLPKTLAHTPIHYYSSTMFVECLACILADTGQTLKFLAQLQNNVNDHNQSSTYLIIYLSFQRAPECRILHSKLQTFSRVLPSNPLGGGGGDAFLALSPRTAVRAPGSASAMWHTTPIRSVKPQTLKSLIKARIEL
jgi:hypothetical protein